MKTVLIFLAAHWYLSLFIQTFFHHRYSAHGQFSMSRISERVFFVLAWIFQGSSYLSPYVYGILHRMHHAYADTEKDPHSPKYDGNIFRMMWRTFRVYSDIQDRKVKIEEKFAKNLPRWRSFDRFAQTWWSKLFWGASYAVFYFYFAPSLWWYLLIPVHWVMSPIHGAIINWFAHTVGYRNYSLTNTSKNILPVDFLMMGEGYHNNHHMFPQEPNFGTKRWFELDFTYLVIKILNFLGIIKFKRTN
jgi:stearoyl-CoA desaturase (delta-9 desaturase)